MDINLENIDIIRERTGISYKEAKEVLEQFNGDVVEALIHLEETEKPLGSNIAGKGDEILSKLKDAIRKGNVTKVVLKKDGDVAMNIPITAGAIGAVLSPPLAALGITAALLSKYSLEIVKEDGEVVNINDITEKTVDKVKNFTKKGENTDNTQTEEENSDQMED